MRTDWRNGQFSIYFKSIHAEHSYVLTYAFLVVFSRFSITNFCTNVSNNENNCNLIIYHYLGIRNQNPFHFSFSGNVSANFGCTYKCPNFIDRHLKLTPGLIFFLCMSLQYFFLIPLNNFLKWCGIICGISIGTWEVPRCREVYITCLEMFHGPSISFGSHTKGMTKIKKAPLS